MSPELFPPQSGFLLRGKRTFILAPGLEGTQAHQAWCHRGNLVALGYDVATLGGYWSIVEDFSCEAWAAEYLSKLNAYGHFSKRETAFAYLEEYRAHRDADWDLDFQVGYVLVVTP